MPRKPKATKAVTCAVHGLRCALGGGSRYRSERCEPAREISQQMLDLRAMLDQAGRAGTGETEAEQKARQAAERQRQARLSPAQIDAEYRDLIAKAKADEAAREARFLAGEHV